MPTLNATEPSGVWQAPVLALSVNPVWHAANQPDAALHGTACPNAH
jgi:hypothetical protein